MRVNIETTRESRDAIYAAVKEKYPEADVRLIVQKSFDAVDLIQIGLSSAQVIIGIMTLIPMVLPKKDEPKIKVIIKDAVKGRELVLEGNKISETKVVKDFLESLND